MAERTAQLIGFTPGCQIKICWNDVQVFDGTLSAAGATDDLAVLAQWSTDTDVVGQVPLVIECSSGSLHFANIFMNMLSPLYGYRDNSDPDRIVDSLTEQESPNDFTRIELESIDTNFQQPLKTSDLSETDGKTSVEINGEAFERHDVDIYAGAWHWLIQEGQTFSCLFQVDDFTS